MSKSFKEEHPLGTSLMMNNEAVSNPGLFNLQFGRKMKNTLWPVTFVEVSRFHINSHPLMQN